MSDILQQTHDTIKDKGFPYYSKDKKWRDDKYNLLIAYKRDTMKDRKTKVKRKVKRNTVYTVVASGKYKGKGVEQGLVDGFGKSPKEIKEIKRAQ